MKKLLLCSLVLPFLLTNVIAQSDPMYQIPTDPTVRSGKLDNGIHYYIQKNAKPENRAELRLAVKAGSTSEDDDQKGVAHFVEHMAFNGTKNFKKSELVDYLESVGTKFGPDLNAYTSFDETVYMLQARTDTLSYLKKGLLVLEDWASAITFEDEEIDKERGVVESEWRSGLGPDQRMFYKYLPVVYKDSRYAERLPIGDPETINTVTYETVRRFYKDWYRPDLMAVIVVGDIDVDLMEKEIKERFSKIPAAAKEARPMKKYKIPRHEDTRIVVLSDPEASFTRVQLTYKHDQQKTKNLLDMRRNIVHSLYNRMINSRIAELTKAAEPPLTFGSWSYGSGFGDLDEYRGFAFVAEGKAMKGLKTLLVENERVLRHGFNQSELDRAKTELMKRSESALKEKDKLQSRNLASRLVYPFLKGNPLPSIEQRHELNQKFMPDITLEDVNALAKNWITEENRSIVITAVEKEGISLPIEDEIRDLLEKVKDLDIEPYEDETSDAPLLDVELAETKIADAKQFEDVDVTELTLANGIKVVLKPTDFKNDEILMQAFSPGGHSLYSDEDYMNASTITSIINEAGLGEFNSVQLGKKLTGKKVRVSPYIGELFEGMSGNASPDDLETLFQLTYLYFTNPRKDETAKQSFISKQKSIFANLISNPQYWFYDQSSKVKYQDNPRRNWPSEEAYAKIDLERAFEIYNDRFSDASDFTFFFVGSFTMEQIKPLITKYLGSLPSTSREEEWKDLDIDLVEGKVEKNFVRGSAPKALVEVMWHGDYDAWETKEVYTYTFMIDVLKIKLREAMREEEGGVYGVGLRGNTSRFPEPRHSITMSFNSEPDNVENLLSIAMKEIEKVRTEGVEEKDMTKVRETLIQARTKAMKENRWWLSSLDNNYRQERNSFATFNLDVYQSVIQSITAAEVQAAAKQYFTQENFIQLVMKPEEKAE
ncbi:MAG: insulinase family protein [Bacteroidota bacterium]